MCKKNNVRLAKSTGANKSRMAERHIRSVKRVVMAMYQTGNYREDWSWDMVIRKAETALNGRFNRNIGTDPDHAEDHLDRLLQESWKAKRLKMPGLYLKEKEKIKPGGEGLLEKGRRYRLDDLVLVPVRRLTGGLRDKEFLTHFDLMPHRIHHIFHAQKPTLFRTKNVSTGRLSKRLYYARELKQIKLPSSVKPEDIEDVRVERGEGLQYKLDRRRGWVTVES